MRSTPNAITELPPSPEDERRSRMIRYTVAMSIRMVCIILAVVVPGWWRVIPIAGAVVLPYIAVVIANNIGSGRGGAVARPGSIVRTTPGTGSQGGDAA